MKKLIVIGVLLLAMTGVTHAQSTKGFGGIGFYYPGFQTSMPKSLGTILPAAYPEAGFNPITHSGGGYVIFYSFIAGAEGGDYTGGTFTKEGLQLDLTGEFGAFKLGYMVLHKEPWFLYPFGTYGSSTLNMFIHNTPGEKDFQAILEQPAISSNVSYTAPVASVGLGFVYTLFGSQTATNYGGFMLGVEAGYQFQAGKGEWTYDNGAVVNGSEMDFSGFFVRLAIGGGGVNYQKAKQK